MLIWVPAAPRFRFRNPSDHTQSSLALQSRQILHHHLLYLLVQRIERAWEQMRRGQEWKRTWERWKYRWRASPLRRDVA